MKNLADAPAPLDGYSDPRKVLKKVDMVEKGRAEAFGDRGTIGADVVENDLQID
jgi:hypothetical protein